MIGRFTTGVCDAVETAPKDRSAPKPSLGGQRMKPDPIPAPASAASEVGVARAYDLWSASYDADRNTTRDLDASVLRSSPLRVRGASVIALGCGTGKNTLWLAEHAASVLALDFSPGMLARARERVAGANVRFVQHDVRTAWPAAHGAADTVVGNLVLEHVEQLAPVYAEAERVLRTGGQLFLCELHPERQRRGSQAHFTHAATGATIHVAAHLHSVADFVNGGIGAGLRLMHLGEWLEPGAPPSSPPRLLTLLFEK
jgi:ubiquinone/menaquinone biosynthesis C-methylase UbiE